MKKLNSYLKIHDVAVSVSSFIIIGKQILVFLNVSKIFIAVVYVNKTILLGCSKNNYDFCKKYVSPFCDVNV